MKFVLIKDADHGDWKTKAVRPESWPTLKKGEEVEFLEKWSNWYGTQIKVRAKNGEIYDLEPQCLEKILEK